MTSSATPWEVVPANEHHGFYIVSAWGQTVCDLYTMSNPTAASVRNGGDSFPVPFSTDYAEADARLIATAPALLAALEWLHLGKGQPVDPAAVIAEARGEA